MKMFKYAFALVVFLTSACLMPHAHAATTCDSTDLPYTLDAGTLSVPTTLDIGGVIQARQRHIPSTEAVPERFPVTPLFPVTTERERKFQACRAFTPLMWTA